MDGKVLRRGLIGGYSVGACDMGSRREEGRLRQAIVAYHWRRREEERHFSSVVTRSNLKFESLRTNRESEFLVLVTERPEKRLTFEFYKVRKSIEISSLN